MPRKLTTAEFIARAHAVHGLRYAYPDEYVNAGTKVRMVCREHGEFWQRPGAHLSGQSCPTCANEARVANMAPHRLKHGHARKGAIDPAWKAWRSMRERCQNPNHHAYASYGGRGITVCPEWDDPAIFLADMGPRPTPNHTLERLDVNGNYEPGNCVWATAKEQARNRRANTIVTLAGETCCLPEWAERVDTSYPLIKNRVRNGGDPLLALTGMAPTYRTGRPNRAQIALFRDEAFRLLEEVTDAA